MKKLLRFVFAIVIPAFIMAGSVAGFAVAQDKDKAPAKAEMTRKTIFENDKVKVIELHAPAGSSAPSDARPARLSFDVKGGTIMRTYPDGKKVKVETKTGGVRWLDAETYSFQNVGKSEIVQRVVYVK